MAEPSDPPARPASPAPAPPPEHDLEPVLPSPFDGPRALPGEPAESPPAPAAGGSGAPAGPSDGLLSPGTGWAAPHGPEPGPVAGLPPAALGPSSAQAPGSRSAAGRRRHPSYVFLAAVTIFSLLGDLATKAWAKEHFEALDKGEPRHFVLVDGLVSFIYAKNRGGAWGLLQNETESLRRPFFLIVSVIAIVFIVSLYRKLSPGQRALKWGLPLVLGGALGNLVDRIRYGFVIDFVDVYVSWGGDIKHWPTFNVADIAICVGVGLMAIDMFTSRKPRRTAASSGGPLPSTVPSERGPGAVVGEPTGDGAADAGSLGSSEGSALPRVAPSPAPPDEPSGERA